MIGYGIHKLAIAFSLIGAVSACAASDPAKVEYLGASATLLDAGLVNIFVQMRGAQGRNDVAAYADCAVAGYAMDHDYSFARHLRTVIKQKDKIWHGDAVYTVSAGLPRGEKIIDAEVTLAACTQNGVPRVKNNG